MRQQSVGNLVQLGNTLAVRTKQRGLVAVQADVSSRVAGRGDVGHSHNLNLAVNISVNNGSLAHIGQYSVATQRVGVIQGQGVEHVTTIVFNYVVGKGGNLGLVGENGGHFISREKKKFRNASASLAVFGPYQKANS